MCPAVVLLCPDTEGVLQQVTECPGLPLPQDLHDGRIQMKTLTNKWYEEVRQGPSGSEDDEQELLQQSGAGARWAPTGASPRGPGPDCTGAAEPRVNFHISDMPCAPCLGKTHSSAVTVQEGKPTRVRRWMAWRKNLLFGLHCIAVPCSLLKSRAICHEMMTLLVAGASSHPKACCDHTLQCRAFVWLCKTEQIALYLLYMYIKVYSFTAWRVLTVYTVNLFQH